MVSSIYTSVFPALFICNFPLILAVPIPTFPVLLLYISAQFPVQYPLHHPAPAHEITRFSLNTYTRFPASSIPRTFHENPVSSSKPLMRVPPAPS